MSISPGSKIRFALVNLSPSSYYEVRISYPANYPTIFRMRLEEPEVFHNRKLLNTEKIMFNTNSRGHIEGHEPPHDGERYHVIVQAEQEGVWPQGADGLRDVPFDIVLETLFYGIPRHSLRIAMSLFVGIILSCVFMPQILSLLKGRKKKAE
ncbi:hypothetical protein PROFUN_06780 [Planoprotostelium fungivorum]|uniref:Uncharacterized protein n=1 Tax=Planoprotostelium fungivorum TaxID=1890364 RepID=A0A2P6NNS0_9EUKA|nr:hypothetical protein PROFUN_06780 [Planoprotostelium fungivorum]